MKRIIQVLLVLVFVLSQGTMSWACSCVQRTSCGVRRYGDVDFVGEVVSRRVMPSDGKSGFFRVQLEIRVIETFRGPQKVGEVVAVRTGFGGGDCGYGFKTNAKYLIDASRNGDVLVTGICFLTAPVEEAEVELRNLRGIAAGQRVPDLTGVLMRGTETDDDYSVTPLTSVSVEATPISGGSPQKTVTDALGSFTFARLPKGKYKLILGLPANLTCAYTDSGILSEDEVPSISIEGTNGDSAACHIRLVTETSGSISGIVKYSNGSPIEGWVNADTVTPNDKPWNTVRTAVPGADGKFTLGHLKPGRYSILFTSRAGFVQGKRQVIELKDGERRTGVVLLPQ